MNTDVEHLLREGMERFTADLRAPAGLTGRAARRRRRRLALHSVAGLAAALTAGAVAVVAAVVPGALHNGTVGQTVDTAYVVKHVSSALNAAEPGEIAQMTVTTRGALIPGGTTATTTTQEWSYRGQWRSVTYSTAGNPVYDEGSSTSPVYTVVSYLTRTWARQPGLRRPALPASGPHGCNAVVASPPNPRGLPSPATGPDTSPLPRRPPVPVLFGFGLPGTGFPASSLVASSLPATVARDLRAAISCGTMAVAGRQRVDGIEAIELTSRRNSPISETIWVSPGTYLPVRVVVRSALGPRALRQTADITWLPPTAQNLAKLTVPIPAGFRQVPLASVVLPILQRILGGPVGKAGRPRLLLPDGPGPDSR